MGLLKRRADGGTEEKRGQYIYRGHTTMLCGGLLSWAKMLLLGGDDRGPLSSSQLFFFFFLPSR